MSSQQQDISLGTHATQVISQGQRNSLAFTSVKTETARESPPSSTRSQGLPTGMPRGLARFLRVRKKAWVEGQCGTSTFSKPEFQQRSVSPDYRAATTVETIQAHRESPQFISSKAMCLQTELSCRRRRALFESECHDPKLQKVPRTSCAPPSPAQPKEEHVGGEVSQVGAKMNVNEYTTTGAGTSREMNVNEYNTSSGAGSSREMRLRLSPDCDGAQDNWSEEFQRWLSERVQREARTPSEERTASSLRECVKLQSELDLALAKNSLLRGEGLGGCSDLHLHHIAKELERALSSVHAERRRRAFNRRMKHRSGALDSQEE